MSEPLQDKMKTGDQPVQAEIRCAKCGEVVKPDSTHDCQWQKKEGE